MSYDHLLLVGFGGPERPEEVWPFLLKLTEGTRIPEVRLRTVAGNYEATGGFSQYNNHARRLAAALKPGLPVFLGMRAWKPWLSDVVKEISGRGLRRGVALVLAPHRSEASFGRYKAALETACQGTGLDYDFIKPWHSHPLFIGALAERIRPLLQQEPEAQLLFTAHSIPLEMAGGCSYEAELRETARLVAGALRAHDWSIAYQSRSGPPGQPWLEPDFLNEILRLAADGARSLVAAPIGFLFDHTEVTYDLDIQARQLAEREGLRFLRAPTVMEHPSFVRMIEELAKEHMSRVQNLA